jgi:subtilisin family serine protease
MSHPRDVRITLCSLATLVALAACSGPDAPPVAPVGSPDLAAGSQAPLYLVSFTDDVTDVRGVARQMAARGGFTLKHVREHAARGFSAVIPPAALAALRTDPRVLILEQDGPVQLDLPRAEAGPPSSGQTVSYGLTRVGGSGDGTGKTAWIIDTGIDLDHPDLNTSRACHTNFVERGTDQSGDDMNGHGTHVSGIVAAKNNSTGTLGVAANAYVCSVRVLDAGGFGYWSWIVNGINHVAANGIAGEVANMSLGGRGENATVEKAVLDASARVAFSLAAGNNGEDANNFTPARVNGRNIYTVSAINSSDCMASWSNFGNPPVDYAAPGVGIVSTYKGGGTRSLSGTSMAAPHVAGILLLGRVSSDGTASCDPDGNPDPIAHR